jgi:hypothetical protein
MKERARAAGVGLIAIARRFLWHFLPMLASYNRNKQLGGLYNRTVHTKVMDGLVARWSVIGDGACESSRTIGRLDLYTFTVYA